MTNYILGAATSNTAAEACAVGTAVLLDAQAAIVTAASAYLADAANAANAAAAEAEASAKPAAQAVAADDITRVGSFSPAARHRRPRAMSVIEDRYREKSR